MSRRRRSPTTTLPPVLKTTDRTLATYRHADTLLSFPFISSPSPYTLTIYLAFSIDGCMSSNVLLLTSIPRSSCISLLPTSLLSIASVLHSLSSRCFAASLHSFVLLNDFLLLLYHLQCISVSFTL